MFCPYCGHEKTRVTTTIKNLHNKRYRICEKCLKSFPTIEAVYHDLYWQQYMSDTKHLLPNKNEQQGLFDD